jgi:hypothetical protein
MKHQASPVLDHHLEVSAPASYQMRCELAAAMRNPSILEPNITPVLDILMKTEGLRVEADGEAEVDVASLPASTIHELHALLVGPKIMPASKGGSGTTPVRRRASAASTHVDAGPAAAGAPPKDAAPAKPARSFKSLLGNALVLLLHDDQLLPVAIENVITVCIEDDALAVDDEGEPTLDLDTLGISTMLKLYRVMMRTKRAIAKDGAV